MTNTSYEQEKCVFLLFWWTGPLKFTSLDCFDNYFATIWSVFFNETHFYFIKVHLSYFLHAALLMHTHCDKWGSATLNAPTAASQFCEALCFPSSAFGGWRKHWQLRASAVSHTHSNTSLLLLSSETERVLHYCSVDSTLIWDQEPLCLCIRGVGAAWLIHAKSGRGLWGWM